MVISVSLDGRGVRWEATHPEMPFAPLARPGGSLALFASAVR
jgi:hypothetical protein